MQRLFSVDLKNRVEYPSQKEKENQTPERNVVASLCCEHFVTMEYFINNPCVFHRASRKLCENLSLIEMKSLSLVSRQWFESTGASIVENCVFRAKNSSNVRRTIRHYKRYKLESEEVGNILRALHSSIKEKQSLNPKKNFDVEKILLENCIMSARDIRSLFNFESLKYLEIIHCRMGDGSGLIKVPSMRLEKLKVNNSVPIFVENLINSSSKHTLKTLHLTTAKEDLLDRLRIPNLEKFTLWETENFYNLDTFLRNHSRLTYCNFEGLQLPDFIFTTISRHLQKLTTLKINRYSDLSDYSLVVIKSLQHLENLSISRMSLPTSALTKIGTAKLKTLDLAHLRTSLTFQDFEQLFKNMPNLTDLRISYCKENITGQVVTLISKSFLNLEVLDLSGNEYLCREESSSQNIFNNLRRLILDNSRINDNFLRNIQAQKLIELDICLNGVSCDSFQEFILTSPFIKKLYLRNCDCINDQGTNQIVKALTFLEHFEMGQCNNLTIESVRSVLLGSFIRETYLTVNTSVEELNMICANRDFVLEHHGVVCEITNACREMTVYRI